MNFFCRLFGHTWWPEVDAPEVRWNTTKGMQTLASSFGEPEIRHYEVCKRCGERRDVSARRLDADRPTNDELTVEKRTQKEPA